MMNTLESCILLFYYIINILHRTAAPIKGIFDQIFTYKVQLKFERMVSFNKISSYIQKYYEITFTDYMRPMKFADTYT